MAYLIQLSSCFDSKSLPVPARHSAMRRAQLERHWCLSWLQHRTHWQPLDLQRQRQLGFDSLQRLGQLQEQEQEQEA